MSTTTQEIPATSEDAQVDDGSPVISLKNVTKKYILGAQEILALDDVSLDIFKGDLVTIRGPSGCGKTTLLNMLGLMDRPTSGDVIILGKSTRELLEDGQGKDSSRNKIFKKESAISDKEQARLRAKHIGFVFQSYNLIPHLTALGNVKFAVAAGGVRNEKKQKEIATKALERVGLGDRLNNMPNELSGGQQQRVAIARALVNKPSIIIGDEPTGNLDSENGEKIIELFKGLNDDGNTILIVTHDKNVASIGKRKIEMKDYDIISDSAFP